MTELKTQKTNQPAEEFLNTIEPEQKRKDGFRLLELYKKATGLAPAMWGTSIVGFGKYHYKSERSAQEGDWPLSAFSPRKQTLTLYVMEGNENNPDLKKLGKHKTSRACLYINKMSDVDEKILAKLIEKSYQHAKKKYSSI